MRYRGCRFVNCNLDVVTYCSRYQNENKSVIRGKALDGDRLISHAKGVGSP